MTKYATWFQATIIRVIRTAAAVALGVIGASTTLDGVDWSLVWRTTALSAILTFLLALTGLPEINGAAVPITNPNPSE